MKTIYTKLLCAAMLLMGTTIQPNIFEDFGHWAGGAAEDVGKGVTSAVDTVGKGVTEAANWTAGAVETAGKGITKAGKEVGKGFAWVGKKTGKGAEDLGKKVAHTAKDVGHAVADRFKDTKVTRAADYAARQAALGIAYGTATAVLQSVKQISSGPMLAAQGVTLASVEAAKGILAGVKLAQQGILQGSAELTKGVLAGVHGITTGALETGKFVTKEVLGQFDINKVSYKGDLKSMEHGRLGKVEVDCKVFGQHLPLTVDLDPAKAIEAIFEPVIDAIVDGITGPFKKSIAQVKHEKIQKYEKINQALGAPESMAAQQAVTAVQQLQNDIAAINKAEATINRLDAVKNETASFEQLKAGRSATPETDSLFRGTFIDSKLDFFFEVDPVWASKLMYNYLTPNEMRIIAQAIDYQDYLTGKTDYIDMHILHYPLGICFNSTQPGCTPELIRRHQAIIRNVQIKEIFYKLPHILELKPGIVDAQIEQANRDSEALFKKLFTARYHDYVEPVIKKQLQKIFPPIIPSDSESYEELYRGAP